LTIRQNKKNKAKKKKSEMEIYKKGSKTEIGKFSSFKLILGLSEKGTNSNGSFRQNHM